jgi:hypothetical protein
MNDRADTSADGRWDERRAVELTRRWFLGASSSLAAGSLAFGTTGAGTAREAQDARAPVRPSRSRTT